MDKIIKILFSIILVFVVFLWLSTFFKTCNKPKSIIGNLPQEDTSVLTPNDDFFKDEEATEDTSSYFDFEDTNKEKNIYDEIDKIAENRQKSEDEKKNNENTTITKTKETQLETKSTESNNKPNEPKNSTTSNGKYLIITGSFLLEKNADDFVVKLKKSGFSGAEKVVFDNSEYFSTIAGRTNDYEQASKLVEKLKQNGFKDCRIKEKK